MTFKFSSRFNGTCLALMLWNIAREYCPFSSGFWNKSKQNGTAKSSLTLAAALSLWFPSMRVILCSFSSNFKWAILILSSLGDGSNAFTTFFVTFWEILIWKPPIDLFQVCPERNSEWNKSILSNSLLPSVKFKDRMTSGKKRYSPPFRNSAISPLCSSMSDLCTSGFSFETLDSVL